MNFAVKSWLKYMGWWKIPSCVGKSLWWLHFISKVSMFQQLWWYQSTATLQES